MKINENGRKMYLLALLLLIAAIAVILAWSMFPDESEPQRVNPTPTLTPVASIEAEPSAELTPLPTPSAGVNTVVYYQDDSGYLVPVMKRIPEEEGIARATLSHMVKSPYNDMQAARLGLRTVIPENVSMEIDVSDSGAARIDLSKEVLNMADLASEERMVSAVVRTLTEFPTIKSVSFLIGGQAVESMTHGCKVAGEFTREALNPEGEAGEDAQSVMLYFPGETGSVIVPVTRYVYGNSDINTAVLELLKGPSATSALDSPLPAGCGLISVEVNEGVATINFTSEFIRLAEESDGGRLALRALVLTCTQFEGVSEVRVQVEGEPYDTGMETLSVPTFVNVASEIEDQFLQTGALLE